MMESIQDNFLNSKRRKIVNGVRDVPSLVDYMIEEKAFSTEIANTILSKSTDEEKVREVLQKLNCSKHKDLMIKWLKENEPNLMEDLVDIEGSAPLHEEPERKRRKSQAEEPMNETNNLVSETLNLKTFSTFAKLEEWASNKSENLIHNLKHKLSTDEMQNLEKMLKNKKLKKSFCFNAEDVRKIKSNQKLKAFLDSDKNVKFPDLVIQFFFEKDTTKPPNDSMMEKDMESNTDDSKMGDKYADRGFESLHNSSCNSNTSRHSSIGSKANTDLKHKVDNDQLPGSEPRLQDAESYVRGQTLDPLTSQYQKPYDTDDYAPLEDTMDMQKTACTRINFSMGAENPMKSKSSKDTQEGTNIDTQERSEFPQNDRETLQQGTEMDFNASDKLKPPVNGQRQASFCSTPLNSSKNVPVSFKRRQAQNKRKLSKPKNEMDLLNKWVMKKCNNEDFKKVFDCISIINKAEHSEYPIFVADNIRVYENPQSGVRQVIFVDDEKDLKTKDFSEATKHLINYQMWVCGIKKTVLLKKGKDEVQEYEIKYNDDVDIVKLCQKFVFEAFLPAFAVFRKLQREKLLSDLPGFMIHPPSSEKPTLLKMSL